MTTNDESGLNNLFQSYRAACPDVEASANFMPGLWQKIEARVGFWAIFQGFARTAMTACAALALLLLALNFALTPQADHTAEKTFYAETIRLNSDQKPQDVPVSLY